MGSAVQVKRLQCMIDGTVKIKSDNQAYEEEYFSPDQIEMLDVEFIGRIVWAGKRM
jgi:phage repressor protein C with HTH and peptisase S24 domain